MECLQSFFITLINSGIFEYFAEYFSDFLLKDLFNILLCDGMCNLEGIRLPSQRVLQSVHCCGYLFLLRCILSEVPSLLLILPGELQVPLLRSRPMFSFLIWCSLCMWMVDTKRMLFCGDIISQCQVEFIEISTLSCDRCDRVVWCIRPSQRKMKASSSV